MQMKILNKDEVPNLEKNNTDEVWVEFELLQTGQAIEIEEEDVSKIYNIYMALFARKKRENKQNMVLSKKENKIYLQKVA